MDVTQTMDTTESTDTGSESPEVTPEVTQSEAPQEPTQSAEEQAIQAKLWKLKINGQEEDVDEKTLVKYAQVGKAGYRAMERAAETEKKAKAAYQKMMEYAAKDPYGLIEMLNPQWKRPQSSGQSDPQQQEVDPRDQRIADLESKLNPLLEHQEQAAIQAERQAIDKEYSDAVKDYQWKSDPFVKEKVFSLYRKYLNADQDVSLEDVAFYVDQEWKQYNRSKETALKTKVTESKKRAPISATPAGGAGTQTPKSFDDIRKLAGML